MQSRKNNNFGLPENWIVLIAVCDEVLYPEICSACWPAGNDVNNTFIGGVPVYLDEAKRFNPAREMQSLYVMALFKSILGY